MHWLSLKELLSWNPLHLKDHQLGSEKIRFDNVFRFWISTSSILVLFGLWMGGVIPAFWPVFTVFVVYGIVQFTASWILRRSRRARAIDFAVCGVDMAALSVAVYWTGGATSPLYFIYFVPLIIQAFHRDWVLILYYGFGGVFLYSVAVLSTISDGTSSNFLDLGARLFFMLMTVSIAALAVNLLRKRDESERVRFSRMKFLTTVSERLSHVNTIANFSAVIEELVVGLNAELASRRTTLARIFLRDSDSRFMKAHVDPANDRPELARELAVNSCPVMTTGKPFYYGGPTPEACPTESFSFKSHLCLPLAGPDGESYGVLFTGSSEPNAFPEADTKFLDFIATSIGLTRQRLDRGDDLDLATEMNSCAVAAFMGSIHGLAPTYEAVVDGLSRILEVDQVSLMVWDLASAMLKTALIRGHYAGQENRLACHLGEGIPGKVLETGESTVQNELTSGAPFSGAIPYKAWLAIPIRTMRGEPLGVLNAWSFESFHLSNRRWDVALTFATRAAIAIENALEREHLKEVGKTPRPGDLRQAA